MSLFHIVFCKCSEMVTTQSGARRSSIFTIEAQLIELRQLAQKEKLFIYWTRLKFSR